ncbi:Ribonuclease, Rne/Rng family [Candidatus Rhodobacter oscarellae]|uniref:Ribonuclease, Rne/Rng family n=1 Tax=Candidatus Rhodobacter oscarellae TaxID=1675527 RepID=A0A0J9EBN4_9RHOB|nr:ribonuclease E/G [Candidatus Rhodobacter lobularis]KMW60056.1 Ribonuclease, Rne/Rng family [Candidatus Rhodobacter lobularis]
MKGRVLAVGRFGGRKAAALLVDGRWSDLIVDPPEDGPPLRGAVCLARPVRSVPKLGGQFVQMAGGATGFLKGDGIPDGTSAPVQVSGFAEPGKAIPVTLKIGFRGCFVVATPGAPGVNVSRQIASEARRHALTQLVRCQERADCGLILRSAAEDAEDSQILAEARRLVAQFDQMTALESGAILAGPDAAEAAQIAWGPMAQSDTAFEDFEVAEFIEAMRSRRVDLSSGGDIFVEPTRAFVAVDVNTGNQTGGAAGLKVNIEAARELPRQLDSRGLGGQVVIDFAPMSRSNRARVERILQEEFARGFVKTRCLGWTKMGLFELQRSRDRMPIF